MPATPPLPAAFQAVGEPSKPLARFKASLARRWRPTRMKELFESVDLAWFLVALGRRDEALEVLRHVLESVAFDPANQNLWSPAGYACCCQAYLLGERDGVEASRRALDPIRRHPFHADLGARLAGEVLKELGAELEKSAPETPSWARHYLARVLAKASFFAQTVAPGSGFSWAGSYDPAPLGRLIEQALGLLRARL